MTMFKTEEYIEKFAKLLTDQMEMENYTKEQVCIAIEEVLKDFQKDLKEVCSEGFNDWLWGVNFGGTTQDEISRMKFAWEMAKLSSMKELQEKDAEIERLEKENKKLKVNLKVCQNDYWFMINLLEKYSSNKEQAIKDCIERMKFRSPIFKQESKE